MIVQFTDTRFIRIHDLEYDKESASLYLEGVKEILTVKLLSEEKYRLLTIAQFRDSLEKAVTDKIKYCIKNNCPIEIEELRVMANSSTR